MESTIDPVAPIDTGKYKPTLKKNCVFKKKWFTEV